jgi:predicted DNA binding CopG/RHH family protein
MKKNNHLDNDEKKILESLDKGEWVSDFDRTVKKKYQEYAKHSLNKHKRINIRMAERDLQKIKINALREGIPYQSLISMLIHKFNEGKITLK